MKAVIQHIGVGLEFILIPENDEDRAQLKSGLKQVGWQNSGDRWTMNELRAEDGVRFNLGRNEKPSEPDPYH